MSMTALVVVALVVIIGFVAVIMVMVWVVVDML